MKTVFRWPSPRRVARLLLLVVTVGGLGYVGSWHRDIPLYYLFRDRISRDMVDFEAQLKATGLPMEKLGDVRYDHTTFPLWVVHGMTHRPDTPTVCLMGNIHGNEPAGAVALLSLAKDLSTQQNRFAPYNYVLLPLANPWGWIHDLRHNGNNQDVARHFNQNDAQEAELIKQWLKKERCTLFVDLHEDRIHHGFYFLDYANPYPEAVQAVVGRIERATGISHADHPLQGVWQFKEKDFADISLTTASLWARQNGIPLALIVETFDGLEMAQRVAIHRQAIAEFVELLKP